MKNFCLFSLILCLTLIVSGCKEPATGGEQMCEYLKEQCKKRNVSRFVCIMDGVEDNYDATDGYKFEGHCLYLGMLGDSDKWAAVYNLDNLVNTQFVLSDDKLSNILYLYFSSSAETPAKAAL